MKYYFLKILLKIYEVFLRMVTFLKRLNKPSDPTSILLEEQTNKQISAYSDFLSFQNSCALKPPKKIRLLIIIPFRDKWILTEQCLKSIEKQIFANLEIHICLVDNSSAEQETIDGVRKWTDSKTIKVESLCVNEAFNFSKLNNLAVEKYKDKHIDYLLFLNNDVELLAKNSLNKLISFAENCCRVGAIGSTLIFPDKRIQHLFLAPGVKIVGAHPLKGKKLNLSDEWFRSPRPVAAVTGAMLLVSYEKFIMASGFDENLPTIGQDLDLCLRLQSLNFVNWVYPNVIAIHNETSTRAKLFSCAEIELIYGKWGNQLTQNSCFSENLSRWSERPCYSMKEKDYPWRIFATNAIRE